jgi:hypothetical protein
MDTNGPNATTKQILTGINATYGLMLFPEPLRDYRLNNYDGKAGGHA